VLQAAGRASTDDAIGSAALPTRRPLPGGPRPTVAG